MIAAALLALIVGAVDGLDREQLVDDLRYGVSFHLKWHLTLSEFEERPKDVWLVELLDRNATDEDHPAAALRRARTAAHARDDEGLRDALRPAIEGLRELLADEDGLDEVAAVEVRVMLGFGYSLLLWAGGPVSYLSATDELLREAYRRDPSCWHALSILAEAYLNAAYRTAPDRKRELLQYGVEILDLGLADHPAEDRLRLARANLRFILWLSEPCDLREPDCLARMLAMWSEMRDAVRDEPLAAANRAVAASLVVGLLASSLLEPDPELDSETDELAEELAEIRPIVLADLTGALEVDVFAGRVASMIWLIRAAEPGTDDEREAFAQALERYDDPEVLRAIRLLAALQGGDCEWGLSVAEQALAEDDDARVLILAANLRLDCGQPAEAEALLRDRLAQEPDTSVRLGLGILLLRAGRDADAVAELRAAVDEDSSSPLAARVLGVALALSGDLAGGLTELERAREIYDEPSERLDAAIEQVERALAEEDA